MARREPTPGRAEQTLLLEQIDTDAVDSKQGCDPFHGGLERVGEREPRNRLCHDREKCARTLELELDVTGARAKTQSVRNPRRERSQRVELRCPRLLGVAQLKDAEGGLAETDRNHRARVDRVGLDEQRPPDRPHLERQRSCPLERVTAPDAVPGDELEPLAGRLPDRSLLRARRLLRLPDRLACGALQLGAGRQCLSCPRESSEACFTRGADAAPRQHRQGDCKLRCDQPGESERGLVELAFDPNQLQCADDGPTDARGNEQPLRGHLVAWLDPRPGDLRGEQRARRRNRARNEHCLALVEDANDREVSARQLLGGGGEQLEGLGNRDSLGKALCHTREALERQPLGFDHHFRQVCRGGGPGRLESPYGPS